MITKQEFIEGISFELSVIRHLASKVQPETFEFRPTPKQRSLHELMTYMACIFGSAVDNVKAGSPGALDIWKANTPEVTLQNFEELIKKEEAHIKEVVGGMSEAELSESVTLYGRSQSRALHLLNGPFKWAPAYKLQLFMYLKMTGQEHLGTINLWAGMDPMPKE